MNPTKNFKTLSYTGVTEKNHHIFCYKIDTESRIILPIMFTTVKPYYFHLLYTIAFTQPHLLISPMVQ